MIKSLILLLSSSLQTKSVRSFKQSSHPILIPDNKTIQMSSTLHDSNDLNLSSWQPTFTSPFLNPLIESNRPKDESALIILNSHIASPPSEIFQHLWKISTLRVCADGGANRLYYATKMNNHTLQYIPDIITGDLDSLENDVKNYYEQLGSTIERDNDQDHNDLDKAIAAVRDSWQKQDAFSHSMKQGIPVKRNARRIYVYGAFGGRFDHEMASIHALFRYTHLDYTISLYTDETFAILLSPNIDHHIQLKFHSQNIHMEQHGVGEGPTVGLIPISCRCRSITTSGLKWNLDGTVSLSFGGPVFSTSNRAEESVIRIKCSDPIIFTAEMTRLGSGAIPTR